MALIYSAQKLQLLKEGATIHGQEFFKFDIESIRPSHIDRVVSAIYEDLELLDTPSNVLSLVPATAIITEEETITFFTPNSRIEMQDDDGVGPITDDIATYVSTATDRSFMPKSYIDSLVAGGGSDLFNWNRTLKALPQIGVNYGGTTVQEGLEAMFFPFLSAYMSLNGFGLAEVGDDFAPQLIGSITLNDETLVSNRRIFVGGVDTASFVGNSINQAAPANITTNETYQLRTDVDNNGSPTTINSPIRTQSFIYPFLHGMSADANLIQTTIYAGLTKLLQNQGNKNILLNGSSQTIYFAYDSSYPDLAQILDNNGFDVTGNFTQSLLNVDSVGKAIDYTKQFKVYKSAVTTVNSATFQFLF